MVGKASMHQMIFDKVRKYRGYTVSDSLIDINTSLKLGLPTCSLV